MSSNGYRHYDIAPNAFGVGDVVEAQISFEVIRRTLPSPIDSRWNPGGIMDSTFSTWSPGGIFFWLAALPNYCLVPDGFQMDSGWTADFPPGVHGAHPIPSHLTQEEPLFSGLHLDSTWTQNCLNNTVVNIR